MKKLVISLLVLSAFYICKGQESIENNRIGYYFDIESLPVDGFYDCSYAPAAPLYLYYTVGHFYTPGYYYDREGNKIAGMLKYSGSGLKFKSCENEIIKHIAIDSCNAYIIGRDSIAVIDSFYVVKALKTKTKNERSYVLAIKKIDNLTFYGVGQVNSQSHASTYLVKEDSSKNYISFSNNKSKFKETCAGIFPDFEALTEAIQKEKYDESDIPSIVKMVQYKHFYEQNKKLYFSASWDEINDKNEAEYYAEIDTIKKLVFHISYYYMNGIKVYEGDFTSLHPFIKSGEFIFYYPDGKLRKRINYKYNIADTVTDYYSNGNIHRKYTIIEDDSIIHKKHIYYDQVNDIRENKLLDAGGNGIEKFTDPVNKREITYEYHNHLLANAYYLDAGKKIFQFCEKNARLRSINNLRGIFSYRIDYPTESAINYKHGVTLLRFIVDPAGKARDFKIVRSVDSHCDSTVLNFISKYKKKIHCAPGKHMGKKITQELVIPFDFKFVSTMIYIYSKANNNYVPNAGWNQQMMQPTPPPMPMNRF